MTGDRPIDDMIVIIPGILGSVLVDRDGKEVWGASGSSVINNLITFGGALKKLQLPARIGDDDPGDGVSAPRLLPSFYMLPKLWKTDGYGLFAEFFKKRFALSDATNGQVGNFIEFPYDWRLSNRLNARRLSDKIVPALERWRKASNNTNAKFVFVCHSMGGLVARYYLEVLGGRELTRSLVTIGTPYRGSLNALEALVNGLNMGVHPLSFSADTLVRSFPSAYQLLPTYACLDSGDGKLRALTGDDLPDSRMFEQAQTFHREIADAVKTTTGYDTFVFKGIDQPTSQSASLRNGRIEPIRTYNGKDQSGDGTVPRVSSHPPEWEKEGPATRRLSQAHAMLQSMDSIFDDIYGLLSEEDGLLREDMGGTPIGLDIPKMVRLGQPIPIEVKSIEGDSTLALHVVCYNEQGKIHGEPELMQPAGDGRYQVFLKDLPQGAYRVMVRSASATPVDSVSDWTIIWNEEK